MEQGRPLAIGKFIKLTQHGSIETIALDAEISKEIQPHLELYISVGD